MHKKYLIWLYVSAITLLQMWLMWHTQLFGDESFYWLESQFLAISYAELPGWTAWMIGLGSWIFGHSYFAVRIISYMGFLSLFVGIYGINAYLNKQKKSCENFYIVLAMPLLLVVAVLALPDIWLLVFAIWIIYFFIRAIKHNRPLDWLLLGCLIALGINVHVRLWIWLFFAGLSYFVCFYAQIKTLKSLLFLTLPMALLGLIPILLFNFQHDFVLFAFQFGQRHPWQFQFENMTFIVSQLLVVSPIVLLLWFNAILRCKTFFKQQPIVAWILLTAASHWVFYVVMSVFVDGLRTTVHWLLLSYVPVLAIASNLNMHKKLKQLAFISGAVMSVLLLLFFINEKNYPSNTQARILDNSVGWQQLAQVVKRIQRQQQTENLIADYFMTAAEMAFELNQVSHLSVLPHEKNQKHGRHKQLELMQMLLPEPHDYPHIAILVVEDSGIKLQDKGKYYSQLCQQFKHMQFLESVNIAASKKQFHIFKVHNGDANSPLCDIPPLFYVQQNIIDNQIEISGWVILHHASIQSLRLITDNKEAKIENDRISNLGIQAMFAQIKDENLPNNGFNIVVPLTDIQHNTYHIQAIGSNGRKYFSQYYFTN